VRINLGDVPDHDDGLTVREPFDNNININEVRIVRINDPDRRGQIVVVAAVNVVPAIKLCTAGSFEFVPEFVSAVIGRDGPKVNASNEIRWQRRQFRITALDGPVHHPILLGTERVPSGDSPGRYTAVAIVTRAEIRIEPPHKAVTAEGVRRKIVLRCPLLLPLQAEPAHVVRSQCARHTGIPNVTVPVTVEHTALR
jgi:hypothetical protein